MAFSKKIMPHRQISSDRSSNTKEDSTRLIVIPVLDERRNILFVSFNQPQEIAVHSQRITPQVVEANFFLEGQIETIDVSSFGVENVDKKTFLLFKSGGENTNLAPPAKNFLDIVQKIPGNFELPWTGFFFGLSFWLVADDLVFPPEYPGYFFFLKVKNLKPIIASMEKDDVFFPLFLPAKQSKDSSPRPGLRLPLF